MSTTPLTPTPPPPADMVLVAGPPRPRSRWYMTLPLLIAVGTLAIFAWQRPPDGSEHGTDIYRFLGRFHASLTHFPIGLLILMPVLDLFGIFRRSRYLWSAGQLVMWLATLGMILAATAGYLLARHDGHGGEDVLDHQKVGIITTAWCCVALLFRSLARGGTRRVIWGFLYVIALVFALIGLTFTGHLGGTLTHGDDYLTEYAPQPIRETMENIEKLFDDQTDPSTQPAVPTITLPENTTPPVPTTLPTTTTLPAATTFPAIAPSTGPVAIDAGVALPSPADRTLFASVVEPIFTQHCVECHGAKKIKGDLRLDTYAFTMKGGTSESTVVPGSVADSELVRLIKLPADDDDVMPPPKKPRLTPDEIEAITWWIAQGASETQSVDGEGVPANIRSLAR